MPFAYIGQPHTRESFTAYVAGYDFGTILPDFVVLHHTANPDASWAPTSTNTATWWDRDEADLTETAIRNKRNKQLDGIRNYYSDIGWTAGPHLFIDERYIWLFTPLNTVGIHAKEGNSYRDNAGKLHYSIGIEIVGNYTRFLWPPAVQANVRHAVQALHARLKTFEIVYHAGPLHRPDIHRGGISLHRDYNKPACPGDALTTEWILHVLTQPAPEADEWAARWGPIATPDQTSWSWAVPLAWKANWQRLGKCIGSALYDTTNGIVIQPFENGDVRQRALSEPEVCFR